MVLPQPAPRRATEDPILWLLVLVLAALTAFYTAPGLSPEVVQSFGDSYAMPLLVSVVILAVVVGLRGLPDPQERRFWGLIAVALGFNLTVTLLYLADIRGIERGRLTIDVVYLLFYFTFIRAVQERVDRGRRERTISRVEALATGVFLTGLLVYFVLVPDATNPDIYDTWVPSMLLYWALDVYLLLSLIHLHQSSSSRPWRVQYGWLGLVVLGWTITDSMEAAMYVGWMDDFGSVHPLNVIWCVPYVLLGVAARLRVAPRPALFARIGILPDPATPHRGRVGIVVLFALVLPVLHFTANLLGVLDETSRDAREVTLLVFLPILLGLAYAHQRLLERRADRLEAVGRELEEQRALLSAAVEQTPLAIMVTDGTGRIEYANPAWEVALGRPTSDFIGCPVEEVLIDLGEEAVELFRSARLQGEGFARIGREGAAGGQVQEDFSISPVRDEEGVLTHFSIALRDVTTESMLERQLQQAQRMEALGTLAGGIAHDFNNMLAAILGYSELLLDREETTPDVREDLAEIVKAAERAKDLTAQILTFSRHEDAERVPVHLGAVVTEALRLVQPTIPSSITVQTAVDPEVGQVIAEESRIHQVVMNLVTNAVQAVGEKGVIGIAVDEGHEDWADSSARLSAELPPGRYAVLTVSDDGVGMAAETLDRMYDPFYTTKQFGHGTGLGLSVVHGIVASHGGGISVESEEGAGSTLRVYLPSGYSAPAPADTGEPEDPSAQDTARLLLVDDEEAVAKVLCRGLQRSGFRVTLATDAENALQRFLEAPGSFNALITDQTMPGLTGLELATEVHRVRPRLPVVLLTGYSESVTPDRVAAAGISEVLFKPVGRAELLSAVRGQLGSRGGGASGA